MSVNKFVGDFVKEQVDNYLHKHLDVAEVMQQKIQESEKERKAIAGVTKLARERAKKANLHNKKLRDCHVHLNDAPPKPKRGQDEVVDLRFDSSIFITEATRPPEASHNAVMSTRKRCSLSAENPSTPTD